MRRARPFTRSMSTVRRKTMQLEVTYGEKVRCISAEGQQPPSVHRHHALSTDSTWDSRSSRASRRCVRSHQNSTCNAERRYPRQRLYFNFALLIKSKHPPQKVAPSSGRTGPTRSRGMMSWHVICTIKDLKHRNTQNYGFKSDELLNIYRFYLHNCKYKRCWRGRCTCHPLISLIQWFHPKLAMIFREPAELNASK